MFATHLRALLIVVCGLWLASCSGGSGSGSGTDTGTNGFTLALPDGIHIEAESKQLTLTWPMQEGVTYDLYWSTDPDLDPDVAASNTMEPNITSPLVLSDLSNDQNYFAYLTASADGDTLTSPRLDTRLAAPGVDGGNNTGGGVTTLVQSNDGRLFIGGSFSMTGHGYGNLQVLDDQLGYPRAHPQVNHRVSAVAADGQGGYYFATAWPDYKIRRVKADGQLDPTFNLAIDDDVLTMLVHEDTLYVGGQFSVFGGVSRQNLAAVSLSGNVRGWTPDPNNDIHALLVHEDVLYIGGDFNNANIFGEGTRSYVAAFDLANNRALLDWAPEPNNEVNALAVLGDYIVLGGGFSQVNGEARARLAMVDKEGDLNDVSLDFSSAVNALATQGDWLYVGGQFNTPQPRLLRIDANGILDESWPEATPSNTVYSLLVSDNGVYAGGSFSEVGDRTIRNLARYTHEGELDTRIGYGLDRQVYDLDLVDGRVVIASEALIRVENIQRGVAVLDWDGRWQDFPVTLDGGVQSLRIHQGNLYVGGSFTEASAPGLSEPAVRGGAAAFALDTAELQPFAPQVSRATFSHQVFNILPVDGDFLVSGVFDTVNGATRYGLARVDHLGANADAIDGTDAANGRVRGLALTTNHIYVAGTFEGFGGNASAKHIARIQRTGANSGELDTTWLPDVSNSTFVPSSAGVVDSIVVRDNLIYMTGGFTQFNGSESRFYTAAININNGNLSDWTATLDGPSWSYGLALQYIPGEDGFLIAGTFDTVSGTETGRLALLRRSDASLDTTSNLGNALMDLKQSHGSNAIHLNQATGNVCFGVMRHEEEERLRVGVYCMDSMGNLLW